MMSRNRIAKIEEFFAAEREKKRKRFAEGFPNCKALASHHATAVAAIVLAGQAKIDEPLDQAWARALLHYNINIGGSNRALLDDLIVAAWQLRPKIMGGEKESARFTEIFRTAQVWLLQFTRAAWDARLFGFQLPDLSQTLSWGSAGYEAARRWPLLPSGTMTAGDPIPHDDRRRISIILFSQMRVPILDENTLSQAMKENYSRCDYSAHPLLEGLALLLDLEKNPERELSRYEKRLVRKLERMSGPSG